MPRLEKSKLPLLKRIQLLDDANLAVILKMMVDEIDELKRKVEEIR